MLALELAFVKVIWQEWQWDSFDPRFQRRFNLFFSFLEPCDYDEQA
jgi:hypothetical protein